MAESSFPQSLDYSPNPLSISARSYESKCIPESSSTSYPSEIVRIRIPSGRAGSYLNQNKSFLSFTVVNTSTATAIDQPVETSKGYEDSMARNYAKLYIDGSAYSVIQTQEVYNSSNLLESIQNANVLYNMLVDMQTGMSSRWTGSSILGIGATGLLLRRGLSTEALPCTPPSGRLRTTVSTSFQDEILLVWVGRSLV